LWIAAFCLLHGKWHDSSCWDPLVAALRERGHEVVAPQIPLGDPTAGYVERVRPALAALRDVDDRVVIVGHSLAAAYAPLVAAALRGSLLVYLCPAPTGPFGALDAPLRGTRKDFPFPALNADGMSVWDEDTAIAAMYPRLPVELARSAAARLKPDAPVPDDYPLGTHPDVDTVLVYAANDEFFEPEWERYVSREVLKIEPIEIPGGHFPMLECPEQLADLLERVANARAA
jgi:pimeloyl-ACP methyl ester carboxylesterase